MSTKIQEVFGKFAVELEDGVKLFDTRDDANVAAVEYEKGAENRALAAGYTAFAGLSGKNAAGKANVITAFLSWVAAGRPEAAPKDPETGTDDSEVPETKPAETKF